MAKQDNELDSKVDLTKVPAVAQPLNVNIHDELLFNEVVLTIENLHKKVFTLWYRARFRPTTLNLVANDIKDAHKRGEAYCRKYNLKFISVVHFFADLSSAPPDSKPRYAEDDVPEKV